MAELAGKARPHLGRFGLTLAAAAAALFLALESAAITEWLDWHVVGRDDSIRLGAYAGDVAALEWIAAENGYFDGVGLKVAMSGFASGQAAMDALRAGNVDIATASEYVFVKRSFSEPDLRVLSSISYYRNKAVVGHRQRGIREAADLRGKRIGVTSPSSAEYSFSVFLALHGLKDTDVQLVNLEPAKMADAIADGGIDAAITWEPHVGALQARLGADAVTFERKDLDAYLLLIARQEGLADLSRPIRKLLRALIRAEEWARLHPEDAKRLIASRFKLEADYLDRLWPRIFNEVRLPQELLSTMDGQARWLATKQPAASTAIPNYAGFLRPDELQSVRPTAVTLFGQMQTGSAEGMAQVVAAR